MAVAWLGVVVAAAFLPWAASGRAERSSFALFRVADHLDLLPEGWLATLARLWPLVPFAAACAAAAVALGRPRVAGVLALALGAAVVAAAVLVVRSPLPPRVGTWLAMVAGVGAALAGAVAVVGPGLRPAGRPTPPGTPGAPGTLPVAPPASR